MRVMFSDQHCLQPHQKSDSSLPSFLPSDLRPIFEMEDASVSPNQTSSSGKPRVSFLPVEERHSNASDRARKAYGERRPKTFPLESERNTTTWRPGLLRGITHESFLAHFADDAEINSEDLLSTSRSIDSSLESPVVDPSFLMSGGPLRDDCPLDSTKLRGSSSFKNADFSDSSEEDAGDFLSDVPLLVSDDSSSAVVLAASEDDLHMVAGTTLMKGRERAPRRGGAGAGGRLASFWASWQRPICFLLGVFAASGLAAFIFVFLVRPFPDLGGEPLPGGGTQEGGGRAPIPPLPPVELDTSATVVEDANSAVTSEPERFSGVDVQDVAATPTRPQVSKTLPHRRPPEDGSTMVLPKSSGGRRQCSHLAHDDIVDVLGRRSGNVAGENLRHHDLHSMFTSRRQRHSAPAAFRPSETTQSLRQISLLTGSGLKQAAKTSTVGKELSTPDTNEVALERPREMISTHCGSPAAQSAGSPADCAAEPTVVGPPTSAASPTTSGTGVSRLSSHSFLTARETFSSSLRSSLAASAAAGPATDGAAREQDRSAGRSASSSTSSSADGGGDRVWPSIWERLPVHQVRPIWERLQAEIEAHLPLEGVTHSLSYSPSLFTTGISSINDVDARGEGLATRRGCNRDLQVIWEGGSGE